MASFLDNPTTIYTDVNVKGNVTSENGGLYALGNIQIEGENVNPSKIGGDLQVNGAFTCITKKEAIVGVEEITTTEINPGRSLFTIINSSYSSLVSRYSYTINITTDGDGYLTKSTVTTKEQDSKLNDDQVSLTLIVDKPNNFVLKNNRIALFGKINNGDEDEDVEILDSQSGGGSYLMYETDDKFAWNFQPSISEINGKNDVITQWTQFKGFSIYYELTYQRPITSNKKFFPQFNIINSTNQQKIEYSYFDNTTTKTIKNVGLTLPNHSGKLMCAKETMQTIGTEENPLIYINEHIKDDDLNPQFSIDAKYQNCFLYVDFGYNRIVPNSSGGYGGYLGTFIGPAGKEITTKYKYTSSVNGASGDIKINTIELVFNTFLETDTKLIIGDTGNNEFKLVYCYVTWNKKDSTITYTCHVQNGKSFGTQDFGFVGLRIKGYQ